ncbi:Acetyltransferase (GNAT) domain-containing protein [Butyrivibrio sp. ob235]|uniref:GNAT family N-acetyltransferase n=1 Tax=Butyrivibrio sp. ob235 TaxID=1761780 RepID=UPI0008D296DA|nr:GNAT family N-acetyltransferase [Butyrivibrio sp. ob235]SEL01005.1 Acetyltransferase (GNAT) domain-containing protein [Butyrivibrio sp. ob235]
MITEYLDKNKTRSLYEEAFDDPKAFVDYYYLDKCLDNRMIVSLEDGEVISMLHLNPYYINLCGKVVKSYYVVAVATKEGRRHEGQMSAVFREAFELMKEERVPFIYLMPVDESIYSWMGFEKICDFITERIRDFVEIRKRYDVFCMRDEDYIRRMNKEEALRAEDSGEVLPDSPIIMAKITDLDSFCEAAGYSFDSDEDALKWLKSKRIYISEEV